MLDDELAGKAGIGSRAVNPCRVKARFPPADMTALGSLRRFLAGACAADPAAEPGG